MILIAALAALTAAPLLAQDTCGGGTFTGRKKVDTVKDPGSGKFVEVFCVDDLYFKGEMICGTKRTCFAKCVFDDAGNRDFGIPGPGGGWKEYVWYNWDRTTCNVTIAETRRRAGETEQQQADRIRQLLLDRRCDFNCYSWKPGANKADGDVSGVLLEVFTAGNQIESLFIPDEETEHAFEGGVEYLIEDPAMYADDSRGQVRGGDNAIFEDFEDGILDARYSALPGTGPLTVANGSLNFDIVQHGDGFQIDVKDLNPACLELSDMTVGDFSYGDGFGVQVLFENGESIELEMYQTNSVRVKVKENGTTDLWVRTVPGVDLKDVESVNLDWVPSDTALERVEIEIKTKTCQKIKKKVRSGLSHHDNATVAYRMFGLNIQYDPPMSIGSIGISDAHWDVPGDFYLGVDVDNVSVTGPSHCVAGVGEVYTLDALATGVRSLGIPDREVVYQVSPDSTGFVEFTNQYGLLSENGDEVTLVTDDAGHSYAEFVAVKPGTVIIDVIVESQVTQTYTLEVLPYSDKVQLFERLVRTL